MKLSAGTVKALTTLLNMVGGVGGIAVVLGASQEAFNYIPPQLEHFMNQISSIVALVGVIFVAASVYFFEEKPLPPEDFSKSHVVPIVIGFATLALISSYWHPLSATLVNGFVILALVGSIYRTFTWLRF